MKNAVTDEKNMEIFLISHSVLLQGYREKFRLFFASSLFFENAILLLSSKTSSSWVALWKEKNKIFLFKNIWEYAKVYPGAARTRAARPPARRRWRGTRPSSRACSAWQSPEGCLEFFLKYAFLVWDFSCFFIHL